MTSKKQFFKDLTKSQIKNKQLVELRKLTEIEHLQSNEFTIFPYYLPRGYDSSRQFMKHGPEVKPRRTYSLEQAIKLRNIPVKLREEAFNKIKNPVYCGYSFLPIGKDKRKRKVSLIECLEGARIYAYAHQGTSQIIVKPYSDAKRVRIDGAEVTASLPSRRKDEPRINLKLTSIPIVDSNEKYGITLNFGSDHSCPSKRFNIRYRYTDDKEGSGIFNICAHEIAAYLKLIEDERYNGDYNLIPLQMSQFAIPTQRTVDYYLKLNNNILIKDNNLKSKDKLRLMNRAEKEIALWDLVRNQKHDQTFYATESIDGALKDYDWK